MSEARAKGEVSYPPRTAYHHLTDELLYVVNFTTKISSRSRILPYSLPSGDHETVFLVVSSKYFTLKVAGTLAKVNGTSLKVTGTTDQGDRDIARFEWDMSYELRLFFCGRPTSECQIPTTRIKHMTIVE